MRASGIGKGCGGWRTGQAALPKGAVQRKMAQRRSGVKVAQVLEDRAAYLATLLLRMALKKSELGSITSTSDLLLKLDL